MNLKLAFILLMYVGLLVYVLWLPIYGFGGVFMLLLLRRFRNRPALEICLLVAYFADWGYSNFRPNAGKGITDYGMGAVVFVADGSAMEWAADGATME